MLRIHQRPWGALTLVAVGIGLSCAGSPRAVESRTVVPWTVENETWRDDPAWYDGQAEVAVYAATRPIYGQPRRYRATAYTNKQRMDPSTTTKSAGATGVEVFKQHWAERIPTERYDYDFSTAVFARTGDLSTFKWTCATQEDCGASFKQAWGDGSGWRLFESVYFPDGGQRDERRDGALPLPFDALTLVLRDFPFESGEPVPIELLASQRDTRRVSWEVATHRLIPRGREVVAVPAGAIETHRIDLAADGEEQPMASYWFAADGSAPLLHALVRYVDSDGVSFELESLERYPYWARGPR